MKKIFFSNFKSSKKKNIDELLVDETNEFLKNLIDMKEDGNKEIYELDSAKLNIFKGNYNYYLEKYYYQGRFFSNEFAKCCFKSIYHPNNKINVFS